MAKYSGRHPQLVSLLETSGSPGDAVTHSRRPVCYRSERTSRRADENEQTRTSRPAADQRQSSSRPAANQQQTSRRAKRAWKERVTTTMIKTARVCYRSAVPAHPPWLRIRASPPGDRSGDLVWPPVTLAPVMAPMIGHSLPRSVCVCACACMWVVCV